MPVGLYLLGGARAGCTSCTGQSCILPMTFTRTVSTTNDFYYKPGNRASWARRSRSGGGQNWGRTNASRIGVKRLGGSSS